MLPFASIVIGDSGVTRCARCHRVAQETLRDAPDILEEIRTTLAEWSAPGVPNLTFTGAEPFRHASLFDLIGAAVSGGAGRIRLESDAHALIAPEMVERTLSAGVRHLTIPLLGPVPQLHDSLVGESGSLERTLAGAKNFTDAAQETRTEVHVVARVPVCRHNLENTPQVVTLAAEQGIDAVLLAIDDVELDPPRAAPWLEAACDTGIVCAMWTEVEGIPCGYANGWQLHLSSMYRDVAGDKAEACRACPLDDVCGGVMTGASPRVLQALRPPPDAEEIAERITRGLQPLGAA